MSKAKKIVKEAIEETVPKELYMNTVDNQIEGAKESFDLLIARSEEELEQLEKEQSSVTRYPVLQQRLIHLYLSGNYTITQIARILNIHDSTVRKWLQKPELKESIRAFQQEEDLVIDASLKALRIKALGKYSELMDADNEMVQLMAVRDVMDRTGHKAVEKKEIKVEMSYEERLKQIVQNVEFTQVENEITPEGEIKVMNNE